MINISLHPTAPAAAELASPLACLRAAALFEGVADALLAPLAAAARPMRYARGRQLFAHGEQAEAFFAIVSGEVQLYRPSFQGDEKLFQLLGSGDLLAEAAMFLEPARYPLTARVTQDAQLYLFPRTALHALCDAEPHLMRTLLAVLSRRLYQAVNRIEHLSLNNAGQRLVRYLLELRHHHRGHWIDMPMNIDLPVNIAVLAGQLAMTPETLSRLLQKFRQEGLISGKGRTLVLLDIATLCERVGLAWQDFDTAESMPAMVGCCNLQAS